MNINQTKLENCKCQIRQHSQVVIIGSFLTTIFFLLSLHLFRTYQSTVTILITPKSQVAALQQKDIVSNIAELPGTLAFYDRLLKFNPQVRDVALGESSNQRKLAWNDMLRVRQSKENSSIIKITLSAPDKSDAQQLATITARNLFDTASFYYNIKTDVDLRLIDGPITRSVSLAWGWLLALSILMGTCLAIILQKIVESFLPIDALFDASSLKNGMQNFSQRFFQDKTDEALDSRLDEAEIDVQPTLEIDHAAEQNKTEEDKIDQVQRGKELEALSRIIEQDIYPNYPEMPVHNAPKASAPDNLPIGDDSFYIEQTPQIQEDVNIEPRSDSVPESEEKTHEPTPEELRERLNKLLKGEL